MRKTLLERVYRFSEGRGWLGLLLIVAVFAGLTIHAQAQDQEDPPGRVARLGYMEGSVSFQPAGVDDWVQAVPNRPMTTGDKLWADQNSRAEVQLGSATIDLRPNTGISFLNLDDNTTQIQLSAGSINVRVWDLDANNDFEIDTANQAFSVRAPGRYRLDASENGDYTVVTIREGQGESIGNGQSYTMRAGQRFTLSGTTALNAEVDQIGPPDDFDNWSDRRDARYQDSPSARYCDRRVVGFEDLDNNGDWSSTPEYGDAWFPRVDPGWAPYHEGHWAWIDPWGWTWVDDEPWGYAPFHYGRWANIDGRWGWIPGPMQVRPVYAPALVAFVGVGAVAGGTVAWFPLGPREVYVPSYHVSEAYVNRVNITNTTVNTTVVRNVYNTTIVNNNTTVNNVTYVNRNVRGAVTAVPQHAFATAQPVARAAVAVNARQLSSAPIGVRAAVTPDRQAVLGAHANTAGHVAAPPRAVVSRTVIAKQAPPPPAPSFAARQQALAQHPGQPVPRQELAKLRAATPPPAPPVKVAPPAKPATPTPAPNRPGNQPANARPGANPPANAHPAPSNQPGANNRPAQPNPAGPPPRNERPQPGYRPEPNATQPNRPGANPATPSARPEPNQPETNRPEPNNRPEQPAPPPSRNERPTQPEYRPQPNQPEPNRPEANRPEPAPPSESPARTGHPPTEPANNRYSEQPNTRPSAPPRNEPPRTPAPAPQRSDRPPAAESRPAPQQRPPAKPAPEKKPEKKDQKEEKK